MLAGLAATSVGGEGALSARRWASQVVLTAVTRWASLAGVLVLKRLVGVRPTRGASFVLAHVGVGFALDWR
jgi:hypothetical protein